MFMGIDLLTAFFLVFAGMLVGYFLFYRDRSQDDAVKQRLIRDAEELRTSLNAVNGSYDVLEEKHNRQRGQLNVLQQLCDDWSSTREQGERERSSLEVDLSDRKRKLAELDAELRKEKQLRITAEDQLHKQTQKELQTVSSLEETWTKKYSTTNSRVLQLEAELKAAKLSGSEFKEASTKYKELDKQYALLQQENASLREKLTNLESVEQQCESLRQSLTNNEQQLVKVTEQRDSAITAEKTAANVASGLQNRIDNQESTIHLLRQSQSDALENLKHELNARTEMESKLDARVKELRDQFAAQRTDYEKQIDVLREQIEAQTQQSESHSRDLREQLSLRASELEQEKSRWSLQADSISSKYKEQQATLSGELATLKAKADEYSQTIVKLGAQRDQLRVDVEEARRQMQAQLKQDSESIGQLQRERNELREELSKMHQQLSELQEKLATYELESNRYTVTADELSSTQKRINELQMEISRRDSQMKQLRAESAELQRLRDDYAVSVTRQQQLHTQLEEMRDRFVAVESAQNSNEEMELALHRLQQKLDASEDTIRNLRRERAGVLARLANYRQIADPESTVISFTHAVEQKNKSAYEIEYGGRIRHDEVRGVVFTEAPDSPDDLKRISGIAEVLEQRLNDFGIFTFKQVMEWEPKAIEEFSRLLAFRDRIERDDWQGQARFFYNQKTKQVVPAAA